MVGLVPLLGGIAVMAYQLLAHDAKARKERLKAMHEQRVKDAKGKKRAWLLRQYLEAASEVDRLQEKVQQVDRNYEHASARIKSYEEQLKTALGELNVERGVRKAVEAKGEEELSRRADEIVSLRALVRHYFAWVKS